LRFQQKKEFSKQSIKEEELTSLIRAKLKDSNLKILVVKREVKIYSLCRVKK
jgi:hypothetical protein